MGGTAPGAVEEAAGSIAAEAGTASLSSKHSRCCLQPDVSPDPRLDWPSGQSTHLAGLKKRRRLGWAVRPAPGIVVSGLVGGEEVLGEGGAGELLVHLAGEEQQRVAWPMEHREFLGLSDGVAGDRDDNLHGLAED